ncbi:tRNA dimethylallyltransferase [Rhodobacteraceae bacterium THAF1]|uniref:tRNA (adenosine(37)-N6)-dimethylallyltransferase MiaA n=1 Tax=Palleronia sp. THAF1 TaxID=2587842 RepID=UPI000F3BF588|nr:tRNA (adenosine(37)-N6)-dimethylallyltransferase MiaA [Palleronia sp. THAF1]QFU08895.1 tRNA dimethylallyltransferase [Palleronia sp. THAF1]VDC24393.1 tRNA dimethylallyltransferase [Rhodobacteraceae bacterium THAF1]
MDMKAAIRDAGRDRPVLIAGPTASGKSALALAIAEAHGGVIVNADALQVYARWRVLTARPSDDELAHAPHRLYGHVGANDAYSAGHWLREVAPLLDGSERPIIVGGTGLYFTALTEGLAEIPPTPNEVRAEGDALDQITMLAALDARTRARIDTQNPARVQRAWEVWHATGRGLADWQDDTAPPLLPPEAALTLVIDAPPSLLTPRIETRFDAMLASGAMEEARANAADFDFNRPADRAIGAPELIAYLAGDLTLGDARERAVIATRQYAKRQRTWFRSRMKGWDRVELLTKSSDLPE